ncbi:MAG: short-chain fatty acid transporter [Mucispirillum sp.]|nr:short-chain fatty acid transporter [Mucispirillum sp.]
MFKKFTQGCVALVRGYLPDPFLFAVILTFIVFVIAMPITGQGPIDMVTHWGKGAWNLLGFSMQMALVLVLGQALAIAPPFEKGLGALASIAKTPTQAIILVTVISIVANWLNWGFGLIIGAIFAKELAKKVKDVDYPLLIAAAYSGFVIWHAGLSGSVPLTVASGAKVGELVIEKVPVTETILAPYNLIMIGIILICLPLIMAKMMPSKDKVITVDPSVFLDEKQLKEEEAEEEKHQAKTPAEKLEHSIIVTVILSMLGITWIITYFYNGGGLDLNIVNMIFLFAGIIMHKRPINYVHAITHSAKSSAGIILQFPFYAGIMGMMVAKGPEGVSCAGAMSDFFVSISTESTFPIFTFLSAGLVNLFVPSGGGQWAVQAPIMMPAGESLGVSNAITAMAIAWGDAWTNMIQPFWALPALGIAGLGARDIMGYCVVTLIFVAIVVCGGFFFLA